MNFWLVALQLALLVVLLMGNLAVERVINNKGKETIGRAYAKKIDSASAKNLKTIFDKHIRKKASVKTDGWRAYLPFQKQWNISQQLSEKGENFKQLHIHIMNL